MLLQEELILMNYHMLSTIIFLMMMKYMFIDQVGQVELETKEHQLLLHIVVKEEN